MKVGDKVQRKTTERGYQGIGEIIEVDESQGRARVQWAANRTWYKMARLVVVDEERIADDYSHFADMYSTKY